MALPDKTPSTDKSIEYICVSCWSSFSGDAIARSDDSGLVVCPHCGHAQPTVEEVLAPHEPAPSLPSQPANPADLGQPATAPEGDEPPEEEVLDLGDLMPDDDVEESPADEVPVEIEEAPSEPAAAVSGPEPWEVGDAATMTWKMRSAGGITYNFHGIGAVLTWAASKKNLGNVAISVEGRANWSDYKEFSALCRKLGDPIAALKAMDQPHEKVEEYDDPFADDPLSGYETGDASVGDRADTEAAPAEAPHGDVPKTTGNVAEAKAPRQVGQRPKQTTKTTKDFIFITNKKSASRGGALWFVVGFLFGLVTMFGLWYAGILDQLPIPRL